MKYTIHIRNSVNDAEFFESLEAESPEEARAAFIEKNQNFSWVILDIQGEKPAFKPSPPTPPINTSSPPATGPGQQAHAVMPADHPIPARPGCLTVYIILLGLDAVLILLFGVFFVASWGRSIFFDDEIIWMILVAGIIFALGGFNLFLARGLWQQKNWARVATIVVHSLGLVMGTLSACATMASGSASDGIGAMICGVPIGLLIGIYIINWFSTSKTYFR